ncbi:MAG: hypothetical protein VX641_06510 [Planctomycetota bacterium]|nr:hypothetical protein [Planctomycetota bacterium]
MHAFCSILGLSTLLCLHATQSVPTADALEPWQDRLERLDPSRPVEYLELGEEIMDLAEAHSEEQRLALELFALAGLLDFDRLGRSSILAIGHFTSNPNQKRRMLDAAAMLSDQRLVKRDSLRQRGGDLQDQISFGRLLASLRLEEWEDARAQLAKPGVRSLLVEHGDLLGVDPNTLMLELEAGRASVTGDLKRHLLVEWSVHDRAGLDWAVELEVSHGMPLTVTDVSDLQTLLGADVKRPYWRSGAWSGDPAPGDQSD